MKTKEEALDDLRMVMPHLREAMRLARLQGEPQLGILAIKPTGGGQVVVQFRADEFVSDLCLALGLDVENTEEETTDAAAVRLVQMVERAGGKIRCDALPASPSNGTEGSKDR